MYSIPLLDRPDDNDVAIYDYVFQNATKGLTEIFSPDFQVLPHVTFSNNSWEIPKKYCSSLTVDSERKIEFGPLFLLPAEDNIRDLFVIRAKTICILLKFFKVRNGSRTHALKYATWARMCRTFITVISKIHQSGIHNEYVLRDLGYHSFLKYFHGYGGRSIVSRLIAINAVGRLDDFPEDKIGYELERQGQAIVCDESNSVSYQPYENDELAIMGWVASWVSKNLTEKALSMLSAVKRVELETSSEKNRYKKISEGLLALQEINEWPIELNLTTTNSKVNWKKQLRLNLKGEVLTLFRIIQACNVVILNISLGARRSELLNLSFDNLLDTYAGTPIIRGQIEKHKDTSVDHLWPAADVVMDVLERQRKLKVAFEEYSGNEYQDSLFFPGRADSQKVKNFTSFFSTFSKNIKYAEKTMASHVAGSIHGHRFRYSFARIISLAVTSGPAILQKIFGHHDYSESVGYALSNKGLSGDIDKITNEVRYLMAEEMITTNKQASGPANSKIDSTINAVLVRHGKNELGVDTMEEAIEILAAASSSMHLVRPNVICTKLLNQVGECSKTGGYPNVSACSVNCSHRYEMAAARDDVIQSIELLLLEIDRNTDINSRVFQKAQLETQFSRFADVKAKYEHDKRVMRFYDQIKEMEL
ncbi:tyrosine-type recombinase/integrase [Kordiimonas sp. SCSIO 12603]|uniref:tyrosine-type recombinase/integrase n=1 Tax=Kordiimonas sp. SCSIO 12603 TaxID=2829596 RepID=UPI002105A7DE|nr:tyrosine-type recombinase/integrase [Kordiimonas sp. SCSIO 12603]UTW59667.1 tyrosine-type recombinase/integrase [Kordiimonas sp. SCSIO 12603]